MKMYDKWDELNLKIKDIETVKRIIKLGVPEVVLFNLMVEIYNDGFSKGKMLVLDKVTRCFK